MKLRAGCRLEIIITIFVFFCTCLASSGLSSFNEARNNSFWVVEPVSASTVRLHVVAHSNEPDSRIFKMKIVEQVQRLLTEEKSRLTGHDYQPYLYENLGRLEQQLQQYAATIMAVPPMIVVDLVREEFPLRAYGRIIYPPGEYTALKVIIGEGNGDNWWCLLFPPLCLPFAQVADIGENQAGSDSGCINEAEPSETGGWKFVLTERWSRWLRKN